MKSRILSSQSYYISNPYASHQESGVYAMGIDVVSSDDKGNYKEADVLAHSEGTVLYAGDGDGYGNAVWIEHGEGIVTGYGHMRDIYVKTKQPLKEGEAVGRIGSSGNSTGIHLHFEVRRYKEAYKVPPECGFWDEESFMNRVKFDWINPTDYVCCVLPLSKLRWRVQAGAYRGKELAAVMYRRLKAAGYPAIGKYYDGYYHVQSGAFAKKERADNYAVALKAAGFDAFVTDKDGEDVAL